jgi:hypothetical protein
VDDAEILSRVRKLVDHEHELRAKVARGELGTEDEQAQLRRTEEELDQCWDLLRQRRAHREFGQPVESSAARPVAEVEGYLQ